MLEKRGNIRIMVEVEGWIIYVRFILENIFYLLNKRIIYPKNIKLLTIYTRICFDTLLKLGGYVFTLINCVKSIKSEQTVRIERQRWKAPDNDTVDSAEKIYSN